MGNPPTKPTFWQRMRCRGWAYHTWIDANGDDLTDACAICGIGVYGNLPNPAFRSDFQDGKQNVQHDIPLYVQHETLVGCMHQPRILQMTKSAVNFIQLHGQMIRSAEGCTSTDRNGGVWKDIYLDNVREGIEPTKFRSMLSVLAKKGMYEGDHTGDFGRVRVK